VEGTGSYGAGLARYLAAEGVEVTEVIRPSRQARRRRGKSDAADAVAAALAALNGEASGTPKSGDGAAESIRALQVARRGAIKAHTQAGNQLRDLIVTAPELRDKLAALTTRQRVTLAARFRPGGLTSPAEVAKAAMAAVARRHQVLTAEIAELDTLPGSARPARRPGRVPGQARRRHPGRGYPAHHGRRQPRPAAHQGELRRAMRL
jgi:transposase